MPQNPDSIAAALAQVTARLRTAETTYGRPADSVQLLAVSKTKPTSLIRAAYLCGQRQFGENYLQEALPKIAELRELACIWHFIGPLQSNKTRAVAEHFDWVQSLDRPKLAERLNAQRPSTLPPLNVCIQVNISAEASKSGVKAEELLALADVIAGLPRLTLRGLMAIPAASHELQQQRQAFAQLAQLQRDLQKHGHACDTLSMGMSDDLEAAIAEGATLVRVGSAIFGAREPAHTEPVH